MVNILVGTEVESNNPTYTQVYSATHKGEESLSFMERSFISFTYGGKKIEDFGLIAVTDGERIQRNLYSSFRDLTETYDILDGQFYWGTHFEPFQISFMLSTDGITQQQLDNFKNWFSPGIERELILAEHPNRAIMARVAGAPTISLLPFEKKVTTKIARASFKTSTTLYKGDIVINFIADEPHWYAKNNILGTAPVTTENGFLIYTWDGANGEANILEDPDAIKIILEDGIPIPSMIRIYGKTIFGNGMKITVENIGESTSALIAKFDDPIESPNPPYARIESARINSIGTPSVAEHNGFELSSNLEDAIYLYYAGTAPSYPRISFTMTPKIGEDDYIVEPINSFAGDDVDYNRITLRSKESNNFKITTPSAWTGYNQAIRIFKTMVDESLVDIRIAIRDGVNHYAARAWAIGVIDGIEARPAIKLSSSDMQIACNWMKYFITDNSGEEVSSDFSFDSKTGQAIGTMHYRTMSGTPTYREDFFKSRGGLELEREEDVGDMVRSKYLILKERNFPNDDGEIVAWEDSATGRFNSHIIVANFTKPLTNFKVFFKNMYL